MRRQKFLVLLVMVIICLGITTPALALCRNLSQKTTERNQTLKTYNIVTVIRGELVDSGISTEYKPKVTGGMSASQLSGLNTVVIDEWNTYEGPSPNSSATSRTYKVKITGNKGTWSADIYYVGKGWVPSAGEWSSGEDFTFYFVDTYPPGGR